MAARVMVLVGLAGLVSWTGCLEPSLTYCEDGRACSADLVCDDVHHSCVTPDQLTVCSGTPDGSTCTAGTLVGKCYDNVCIQPGCGNKILELTEQCDDGNTRSGDGCAADCKSTESCGNGLVDDAFGETCDDGNLASNDGCNSRCAPESVTWSSYPVRITNIYRRTIAFDPNRGRVVVFSDTIWEWDGAHWQKPFATPPKISQWAVAAYDPVSHLVVAFAGSSTGLRVYTWDGTTLAELPTTGIASDFYPVGAAAYDPAGKLVVVGIIQSYYFDVAAATWTAIPAPTLTALNSPTLAYSPDLGELVLVDADEAKTFMWNGAGWSSVTAQPRATTGWSLVNDATYHRLLAVGGNTGTVDAFDGASWSPVLSGISRFEPFAWHDPVSGTIGVIGGTSGDDVLTIADTSVSTSAEVHPRDALQSIVYDPVLARVDAFEQTGAAWSWNAGWESIAAAPTFQVNSATYDPVRRGVAALVYDSIAAQSSLQLFTTSWAPIVNVPAGGSLAYDFTGRRLLVGAGTAAYTVTSSGAIEPLPPAPWMSQAFVVSDLGTKTITALAIGPDSGLFDLVGTEWIPSLSPGMEYRVYPELQSRAIWMMPGNPSPMTRQVWERRNGQFKPLGALPVAQSDVARAVTELPHGRLLLLVQGPNGDYLLERQLTSSLPDETCVAGEDADGDGAAGCEDPDCWWSCWPACPVATSCP